MTGTRAGAGRERTRGQATRSLSHCSIVSWFHGPVVPFSNRLL